MENTMVYICFFTDLIHSDHIVIIKKAEELGKLIVGVISDKAIINCGFYEISGYSERKAMFENFNGVSRLVEQKNFSYKENLEKYKPAYVILGNNGEFSFQREIREEVVNILATYGGKLIEYVCPYILKYQDFKNIYRRRGYLSDTRRARLRKILSIKGFVTAMEAHNGVTGLIVEKSEIYQNGWVNQFDAIWISSLCDSVMKGKPDIELVDMTSRFRTIDEIMEITTKPIIFDGDTGGLTEHFVFTVRTLERMGVSMIIIEDKTGLKRNSLLGTDVRQTQDDIVRFCAKIAAGKRAQRTSEFMICARIESLILGSGVDDALERALAYVSAGADAIMIHSRKKDAIDIFEFTHKFREEDRFTPIVVVPTTFNTITEDEFKAHGINIVIYANQLTRIALPAMQKAAQLILENQRSKECDDVCMQWEELISMIPEE